MLITTPRLHLRPWFETDRDDFAALHADPDVMRDAGGPLSRAESDAKLDRYVAAYRQHRFTRWAIQHIEGKFLGYTGVMLSLPDHPLGPHAHIGWRLARTAWGQGYATEAAHAALHDVFTRLQLSRALAYTAPDNYRSQGVMQRLGLSRDPNLDFTDVCGTQQWTWLVWVASPDVLLGRSR